MDVTLGLLSHLPAADHGGGVPSGGSTTSRSNSILTASKEDNNSNKKKTMVFDKNLGDLELGLGLSIGGVGWSQYPRILTDKDCTNLGSRQNSCSSSCSVGVTNSSTSGTKRSATGSVSPSNSTSVVGWPPVRKTHRKPSLANEIKPPTVYLTPIARQNKSETSTTEIEDCCNERNKKYHSVKVNMDGTLIGRKVDLNAHTSYEMLAQTLEQMFFGRRSSIEGAKPSRLLDGTSEFVLTYEDKDGDCMLVGDVPWMMFLSSVKRLRIMRNSESNELAPRFQENVERHKTGVV